MSVCLNCKTPHLIDIYDDTFPIHQFTDRYLLCANVPTQLLDGVGCGELKSVFIATNNGNGIGEVVAKLVDEIDCC